MNDATTLNGRLTAETLDAYFEAGLRVPIKVLEAPECILRIEPPENRLELWLHDDGSSCDTDLARVEIDQEHADGHDWLRISIDVTDARLEGYGLLAAVVDDVVAGRSNAQAITRSIDSFRDLIARRPRMSEEAVVGLVGELLTLEHLVGTIGADPALTAWLGPESEEHDFVLSDVDIEVKSTTSEKRRHRIGTETQLQPTPGRSLWLVSIQVTGAGDASEGMRLGELVSRARQLFIGDERAFDMQLQRLGWRSQDAPMYRQGYVLRTTPAAYHVDDGFPAVTRTRIDSVVPRPELVGPVSYFVDVTSMARVKPPDALHGFVDEGNNT